MTTARTPKSEIIQIISGSSNQGVLWTPIVGDETLALLENLTIDQQSKTSVLNEALAILSRCISPSNKLITHETGIVIGYVQSGKTMSFTTVAALARDNGFQLIVVITGISTLLFTQSSTRLQRDLRLDYRSDRKWQFFQNPAFNENNHRVIINTLTDWMDPIVNKSECQTVLITVMKNHTHLTNLAELLGEMDLKDVPTLVIDDEADQAGLNTLVNIGDQSTTYQHLTSIRRLLPRHAFLQYTATPQAPLLINMIDILSPNFAEVLTPGSDYVGGKDFFIDNPNLTKRIPAVEIPNKDMLPTDPPPTLIEAMLLFFVGVAAGHLLESGRGNRSMMIHPDQGTWSHQIYHRWVLEIKNSWQQILSLPEDDPDRNDLREMFRQAYNDLSSTANELPKFDKIFERLHHAIRRTNVIELNARQSRTPSVDWRANYSNILVGGQAMDRGFTVEGLTVTYMPRKIGVGNADTVQQRARFLGYKREYLGYCRIFLESQVLDVYRAYISHEEDIRNQLIEFKRSGQPLSAWKRAFLLDGRLRPTRKNVLDLPYMQNNFSEGYCELKTPHESEDAIETNRIIFKKLTEVLELLPDPKIQAKTEQTTHSINDNVPLQWIYEQFLTQLRIANRNDSQNFTGLFLQIHNYLETHPNESCSVYGMSFHDGKWTPRRRKIRDNGEVDNMLQGANPSEGPDQGSIYPGDRYIGDRTRIIVQLFNLTVTAKTERQLLADNVPAVAVWVPERVGMDWLIQNRGN